MIYNGIILDIASEMDTEDGLDEVVPFIQEGEADYLLFIVRGQGISVTITDPTANDNAGTDPTTTFGIPYQAGDWDIIPVVGGKEVRMLELAAGASVDYQWLKARKVAI